MTGGKGREVCEHGSCRWDCWHGRRALQHTAGAPCPSVVPPRAADEVPRHPGRGAEPDNHPAGSLERAGRPHGAFPDRGGNEQQVKTGAGGVLLTKCEAAHVLPVLVLCSQLFASPALPAGVCSPKLAPSAPSAPRGSQNWGSFPAGLRAFWSARQLIYAFIYMEKKKKKPFD